MRDVSTWQSRAIEQLSQFFYEEPDVKAFVLSGSFANQEVQTDIWSDVDAKIILADHALDKYYLSTAWLASFGQLVGVEKYQNSLSRTLRVCLDGFQRFDLVFIAESALQPETLRNDNPFQPAHVIIWSKLANPEGQITALPLLKAYQDISDEELESMVDTFWFKAATAIAKVVRNDLLIGLHLALDLERDNLALQMIRRDQKQKTKIHRLGGWGNELVSRFVARTGDSSGEGILGLIKLNCELFDELATKLLSNYQPRGHLLFSSIDNAQQICRERINFSL